MCPLCFARDIGGQTKLRPLWRHYFVNTDALIFVVDSSDLERIEEARDEMFHVLRDPNMDGCQTALILLNKQVIYSWLRVATTEVDVDVARRPEEAAKSPFNFARDTQQAVSLRK